MPNHILSGHLDYSKKVHALVVAAGKGLRLGADIPKQYLRLAGKTVLQTSVSRLNVDDIDDLTLVVAYGDERVQYLDFEFDRPLHYAIGGDERWQSVRFGVEKIRHLGAGDHDWVIIHDAARPCLPKTDLYALLDTLNHTLYDGVILATPVVDTLKKADDDLIVISTTNRTGLWQAQTPQAFRLGALEDMLVQIDKKNLAITDEASGFEMLGKSVQIVQGSRLNIKLTYADDLPLLELIMTHLLDNESMR